KQVPIGDFAQLSFSLRIHAAGPPTKGAVLRQELMLFNDLGTLRAKALTFRELIVDPSDTAWLAGLDVSVPAPLGNNQLAVTVTGTAALNLSWDVEYWAASGPSGLPNTTVVGI